MTSLQARAAVSAGHVRDGDQSRVTSDAPCNGNNRSGTHTHQHETRTGAGNLPGTAAQPYYSDDYVSLYHGDATVLTEWLAGDILLTDPPYGRRWRSGSGLTNADGHGRARKCHGGIPGDLDTATRDAALTMWGERPGLVFGDLLVTQPQHAVQCLIYAKAADAGIRGARAGFRRDVEAIYLIGPWSVGIGGRTSVLQSRSWVAGPSSPAYRHRHPHAKPLDLVEHLLMVAPPGIVADPFAGSGTTLIAARNVGRKAIGVEVDERHCETAARRLDQMCLQFDGPECGENAIKASGALPGHDGNRSTDGTTRQGDSR